MENLHGFSQAVEVDVHDVDFNGVCRVSSLMKYIQSAAQTQLTENGLSYDKLKGMGKAFVLSRIKLEFYSSVRTYDKLCATTFPCDSRGYSFLRCYILKRGEQIVGRGISVWALIDLNSRALIKVNDFDLGLETVAPLNNIVLNHIKLPTVLSFSGKYTVNYADLDQNGHINNTRYADIYANFLPMKNKRIASIAINYANEARFGEVMDVFVSNSDDVYYIRTVMSDGKTNSEAEILLTDI